MRPLRICAFLACLAFASPAAAACRQAELAGLWSFYFTFHNVTLAGDDFFACIVAIAADGEVSTISTCIARDPENHTLRGRFTLDDFCTIAADVTMDNGGAFSEVSLSMTLAAGKNVAVGLALSETANAAASAQGVRHPPR